MFPFTLIEAGLGHLLENFRALFGRRRQTRALRSGAVDAETRRRARETWWGDEPRWYPGGTPPRLHNRVTLLVHGDRFFPELRQALHQARDYVYLIGWCLTPDIALARGDSDLMAQTQLLELLSEAGRQAKIRILLWSGAPALVQPTTRTAEAVQRVIRQQAQGDVECRLDRSSHFGHSHHQKAIVIDGQLAFVGGMDLTTFHGDRWDTPRHPLRVGPTWHDAQVRIDGEAVADVEANFRQRWYASVPGDRLPHREPVVEPSWQTPVQVARTIPLKVYRSAPRGEFGIHHAYTELLSRARRLIYLENQYLWSPEIVDALIAAMNEPRDEPFRIVIVLPARAYTGKWNNDYHVAKLRAADHGRGIFSVYVPYTFGDDGKGHPFVYRPTYVHAKVAVVDDEWFMVGSANLNGRGLATDSEINALVHDATLARELRIQLWAEHLGLSDAEVAATDPSSLVDQVWTAHAERNRATIQQGRGALIGSLHPFQIGKMPGSWLLEEAELLTLDR